MSRAQRLTFLAIAAVIAVAAVVLITRGDATTDDAGTPTVAPTATVAGGATATGAPTPSPTAVPVKTLRGGSVTKLKVTEGDTVRFRATSPKPEEIHVHGYDLKKDIAAGGDTVSFAFKATITGVFEIEYEGAGEQIGQLTVEPK